MSLIRLGAVAAVLGLVTAGILLLVDKGSSHRGSISAPADSSGSAFPRPDQGDRDAMLFDLERRMLDLEQALGSLQANSVVSAAEEVRTGEPMTEITPEEFKQHFQGIVMEIMTEWDEQRKWQEYLKYIEERVETQMRMVSSTITPERKWPLIEVLSNVRRDVVALEERYVKGTFPPVYGSEEWQLWRSSWDDLLARWDAPVRRLVEVPLHSQLPRRLILDMASERLRPYNE